MKISDYFLLTYAIGTEDEMAAYLGNNLFSDGLVNDSSYYLALNLHGTLISFGTLALCFPLGVFVASDFFYRAGKGMFFAKNSRENKPSGLIGKVRSLYITFTR